MLSFLFINIRVTGLTLLCITCFTSYEAFAARRTSVVPQLLITEATAPPARSAWSPRAILDTTRSFTSRGLNTARNLAVSGYTTAREFTANSARAVRERTTYWTRGDGHSAYRKSRHNNFFIEGKLSRKNLQKLKSQQVTASDDTLINAFVWNELAARTANQLFWRNTLLHVVPVTLEGASAVITTITGNMNTAALISHGVIGIANLAAQGGITLRKFDSHRLQKNAELILGKITDDIGPHNTFTTRTEAVRAIETHMRKTIEELNPQATTKEAFADTLTQRAKLSRSGKDYWNYTDGHWKLPEPESVQLPEKLQQRLNKAQATYEAALRKYDLGGGSSSAGSSSASH